MEGGERQYGIANRGYTNYLLERLELSLSACSEILHRINGHSRLQEYSSMLQELIKFLKVIHRRWDEYGEVLDSIQEVPATSSVSSGRGRPQFQIKKDQLEYLSSLVFKWKEIAALLGVSRMTIYRYYHCMQDRIMIIVVIFILCRRRVEFGLIDDPIHEISDEDLTSIIVQIRNDTPFSGVSMICGSLRSRGIKVTRERVRSTLRTVALRWPAGVTKRRPYSVAGPNSLWHVGKLKLAKQLAPI